MSKRDTEIRDWVEQHFGFRPEPDWIAHCKRLWDLPIEDESIFEKGRFEMCPPNKQAAIKEAFQTFGLLPKRLRAG